MKERVSLRIGKKPIILVTPHGADDIHTATIAAKAAEKLDCYAIINQGFERSTTVDAKEDKADCNRIDHIQQPVVFDEFLKPIQKFVRLCEAKLFKSPGTWNIGPYWNQPRGANQHVLIFLVHGAGDVIHKMAKETVEVVLGYGLGNVKDSLSCELWRKNLFVDQYRKVVTEGEVYEASGGSNYAGRAANNLNQYFRKHCNNPMVESMQLEFPYSMRKDEHKAELTAAKLAVVLDVMYRTTTYRHNPAPKFI